MFFSNRNRMNRSDTSRTARPLRLYAAALVLAFCALRVGADANSADPNRYIADVKALASPAMEGRGAGTKGIERAADLIEQRYKTLGLQPAGSKSYFQPFTVITGAKLKDGNRLEVADGKSKETLKLNQDFVPFSFSASAAAAGPVVFAGYGATAPEFGYDDYAHLDVKDKIVLLLRYEPSGFAAKSGNAGFTQHSQLITKAINARNHGAKAVILVNGKLGDNEDDQLTKFGSVNGPENAGVVIVQAKNDATNAWFAAAGKSLAEVQSQINTSSAPASFSFPEKLQVSLNVNVEKTRATVNNVLAYLPGKTDEYIIIGAHYDHLGYGNVDSLAPSQIGQIHPGADDNASGTAGVLELARMLAPRKGQLQRGILFADFAGEELGLLGSAEWVKEPTLPLDKAVAMINMDMIGRIKDEKIFIGGTGTGATFKELLDGEKDKFPFHFEYSASGYAASDHTSFVGRKIPVLFFFSGLHSDYHKPSDTWDKIDAPDAAKLLDFIGDVALKIDSSNERVAFVSVKEDQPHGQAASGGGGGYGPYFGSIPDFGQEENGVKFSDVRPGSPAATAGFRAGDVLVQFGEMPIHNLYDFTDALRRSKVGDVVDVQVLRDGKPVKASVTLEQRK
ncbi:MAG TPA: M28 family peptidase [Candidatus Acidoferrales bacterium]|nr:M28 family peptidase [Candidatus Acidoferrales bacterium]